MDEDWCAVDMSGGPEFARMAGAPLLASDAAVLCVSPDPAEAALAAPWLRAIEEAGTPCMIFINRMDTPKGRVRDIVAALQAYTNHAIVLRQIPIREDGQVVGAIDLISERAWRYREGQPSTLVAMPKAEADREHEARAELLEHMSDFDDALLEELIEDHEPAAGALFSIARRETQDAVLIPTFLGAASHMNGVMRLMKALRHEAPGLTRCARAWGRRMPSPSAFTRKTASTWENASSCGRWPMACRSAASLAATTWAGWRNLAARVISTASRRARSR